MNQVEFLDPLCFRDFLKSRSFLAKMDQAFLQRELAFGFPAVAFGGGTVSVSSGGEFWGFWSSEFFGYSSTIGGRLRLQRKRNNIIKAD